MGEKISEQIRLREEKTFILFKEESLSKNQKGLCRKLTHKANQENPETAKEKIHFNEKIFAKNDEIQNVEHEFETLTFLI